jgi:hypothetical protein
MRCAGAFVFALTSAVTLATLASCRGSMKGDLRSTVNGRPVDFRSAYALSHGGRSFRLYASNHRRGVDWALREGVGAIESGEMSVGADVAPVFRDDGVLEWKIVGLWWLGDSRAGWSVGALAFDTWPVDVSSGPGCGYHLRVHLSNVGRDAGAARPKEDEVTLDGDFDAACAQALAPTTSPPMQLHVDAESFPLTRAGATPHADRRGTTVRVSRLLEPCSETTTHEDAYLELDVDASFHVVHASMAGLVLPTFGWTAEGALPEATRTPDGARLRLTGSMQMARTGGVLTPEGHLDRGATYTVTVDGEVPLVSCPRP